MPEGIVVPADLKAKIRKLSFISDDPAQGLFCREFIVCCSLLLLYIRDVFMTAIFLCAFEVGLPPGASVAQC